MAASSSAASSSTSFARLLKSSKVVSQYDPTLPLVYTSHGGSFKRSDFGLKRALPRLKTPAIRVQHLDSPVTKLTEFQYASKELKFVQRWREAGVGIRGAGKRAEERMRESDTIRDVGELRGGCAWDRANFEDVEELKQIAKTGKKRANRQRAEAQRQGRLRRIQRALQDGSQDTTASQGQSAPREASDADMASSPSSSTSSTLDPAVQYFGPDYLSLDDAAFNRLISKLESLRPKFIEFLLQHPKALDLDLDRRHSKESIDSYTVRKIYDAARVDEGESWLLIQQFLARELGSSSHDPVLNTLRPQPHFSLGLSYAPPTLYQSDVAARPIPGRVLQEARAKTKTGSGAPVTALGIIADTPKIDHAKISPTAWLPDSTGTLSPDWGVSPSFRIESATLASKNLEVSRSREATSRDSDNLPDPARTIVDDGLVVLSLYNTSGSDLSGIRDPQNGRIGSMAWVGRQASKKEGTRSVAQASNKELFEGPENMDRFGNRKITPPKTNEFYGPDSPKGGKARASDVNYGNLMNSLMLLSDPKPRKG